MTKAIGTQKKEEVKKMKIEDLKCCGNCDCFNHGKYCFKEIKITHFNKYCDKWKYDGLTQEERK